MRHKTGEAEIGISVKVSIPMAEHLRHIARKTALAERRAVSVGSLVRDALLKVYGQGMQNPEAAPPAVQ